MRLSGRGAAGWRMVRGHAAAPQAEEGRSRGQWDEPSPERPAGKET